MDFLDGLRESIAAFIRSGLPEPHSSLLLGMILGIKSNFSHDFYETLRTTGTLHVVVVSGFNITVIINTLARMLVFIPLRPRVFITLVFLIAFVLLVGPNPPVVRAALMGTIGLIGTVLGRQRDALRTLLIASGGMLLFGQLPARFLRRAGQFDSQLRLGEGDAFGGEIALYLFDDVAVARPLEIRVDDGPGIGVRRLACGQAQFLGGPQPEQLVASSGDPERQFLIALELGFEAFLAIPEAVHDNPSFFPDLVTDSTRALTG